MATPPPFAFPHPVLTPISGKPRGLDISILEQELYANAMIVPSTSGGGAHGHLGMLMSTTDYQTASGQAVPFTTPVHPGDLPVPAAGSTQAAILQNNRVYDQNLHNYNAYSTLQAQLKQQLLIAVADPYLASLKHHKFGYSARTVKELLTHLRDNYGTITAAELEQNRQSIQQPWDPNKDLTKLWTKVTAVRQLASENGSPIDDRTIIQLLYNALSPSDVYTQALQAWHLKATDASTYAQFTEHMNQYDDLRALFPVTTKDAGYHGAHNVQRDDTTPPPHPLPQLENTPIEPVCAVATTNTGVSPTVNHVLYCWTHGITRGTSQHTSGTCKKRADGHQTEATLYNRMGGSESLTCLTSRRGTKKH